MASLLSLPAELREAIWDFLPFCDDGTTYGFPTPSSRSQSQQSRVPYLSLSLTCWTLNVEVRAHLYRNIHLSLGHPNEFLDWVSRIGPHNSSTVENLVLSTKQLPATEDAQTWANESAWALCLRGMPRLRSWNVQFADDLKNATFVSQNNVALPSSELLQKLSISALECSTIAPEFSASTRSNHWSYQPILSQHPFTLAFISLHETMPPILLQYFNTVIRKGQSIKSSKVRPLVPTSMEEHITGLAPPFFEDNGFQLMDTCTFNENNENANVVLTFARTSMNTKTSFQLVQRMMRDLPKLGYLRIGCKDLDSSFLVHVPKHLHTLDVAFTDNNADRVADNLMTMRGICRNLFTLAIAVSPLHDRKGAEMDQGEEIFFNRDLVDNETLENWKPFWEALDEIKASKVRIWEGEGPGFPSAKVGVHRKP